MNDDTIIGGVLNQLGQTAKKTVQQVVNLPAASSEASEPKEEKKPVKQWESDEERKKFLQDLYGKSDTPQPATQLDKKPEEQKKLMELRQQLHKQNYYDPTFNPAKKQEERPAEKVENEKKKEMVDLQQKDAKKPPPLAVVREQNKAEQFRGASG